MEALGRRIHTLRTALGWSQCELSQRANIRQALISELESGRKLDTTGRNIAKFARTLGVPIQYLMGEEDATSCYRL